MTALTPASAAKALLYLRRAMALRCPVCGESPLFAPWRSVRTLDAWLSPLDGCPRCRYRYDREPGYFLLAIWAFNYGFVAIAALAAYLLLTSLANLSLTALLLCLLVPMPFVSLLVARHAKAFWIAFDHFVDPAKKRPPTTPASR
jgi:uncharacterized protein (DUF983 family)